MYKRISISILLAFSVMLVIAGCDTGADEEESLTVRVPRDLNSLDPADPATVTDHEMIDTVFEGLVTRDPETNDVVNELAEEFELADDGLSIHFVLKEGMEFHGGYGEVTAEDVKFSYERIAGLTDPAFDSPYASDWATLEEVEVHDTYSGTIRLSERFAPLTVSTLPSTAGKVVSKDAVEELGEDFGTNPIGSGPYEFVEWLPEQEVNFTRFEDYGGARHDFFGEMVWSDIQFLVITDDSAADVAIESLEADFGEISTGSIDRFEEMDGITVTEQPTVNYSWISLNTQHENLEDIQVREAIRHAVDVPAVIEGAFDDAWDRAVAPIGPGMPLGHWDEAPTYERDLERAEQLLDEAGVEGLELSFTFSETTGARSTAEIVQDNLADVGITVTLNEVDQATFFDLGEHLRDRELTFVMFETLLDPSWVFTWFTCDQIDVWNWMYYCDEEFDALHEAALTGVDQEARHDMYVEMQQIWDEAINAVWLGHPVLYFAHDEDLQPESSAEGGRFRAWAFRQS